MTVAGTTPRLSWNLAADLRPAVVVLPIHGRGRCRRRLEYATERDLKVVVQGTGHGASVHGSHRCDACCSTCVRCARSKSTRRTGEPGSKPGPCGRTWSWHGHRAGADRAARVVRRNAASSATRWAVASAGSPRHARPLGGGACSPSRSSPLTALFACRSDAEHRAVLGACARRRWPRSRRRDGDRAVRGRGARRRP